MGLTFPIAPTIAANDRLKASQLIGLANSINDRERSGVGNITERRVWWAYNAFRQVRLPNGDSFPAEGEFWYIYHHLDPRAVSSNDFPRWPEAGPGEPEGANLSSIFNAFTFGSSNLYDEETRLGIMELWNGNQPPSTPEDFWELGKLQRGVIDPDSGEQYCPAIMAAQSANLTTAGTGFRNFHGKAWGGVFPTPVQLSGSCGSGDYADTPSYEIFFTATNPDAATSGLHGTVSDAGGVPRVTYAGTCPFESDDVTDGHVLQIYNVGKFYAVAVFDSATPGNVVFDLFPTADWIQGPYTGAGRLYRYDGGHVSRAAWAFTNDFRGTPEQRNPDTYKIEDIAFSFQEFLSRQYLLAPNIGAEAGGGLEARYPTATKKVASVAASGTYLNFGPRDYHEYRDGYKLTGFFAKATNILGSFTLEVLADDALIGSLTLTADEPSALKFLTDSIEPSRIKVRLATSAKFSGTGNITFEAMEQYAYNPDHFDGYMLLRLMATVGGFEGEGNAIDGSGQDANAAKALYTTYQTYGCVVNQTTAGVRSLINAVNESPIHEAARRMTRTARIVPRQQLVSYGVSGGVVTMRFKRYPYGLNNVKADAFEGIAPSWRAVTEIVEGVVYVVRSHTGGSISYLGSTFSHNKRFTGSADSSEFSINGDAELLEYEGIRADAPKNGWSNEWLMFVNFHVHHPSNSSIWKLDSYSDHYTFNNRAAFYADGVSSDMSTDLHVMGTIGGANIRANHFSFEMPSAYRYYGGLNSSADSTFQKSCQLFPKPYELASATVEFVEGGDDIVKLVFKSAFQTHPDAPATVDADPYSWISGEISDLDAEDYRTDDNGIRQYIAMDRLGHYAAVKVGDVAYEAMTYVTTLPDNPFACCIPKFFFSKLISKPYADGNDTIQSHDSRVVIDQFREMESWLRCACEGFVDGTTTQSLQCGDGGTPYDYTFENLCFDAFGDTKIADFSSGHGPQVNTELLASMFNKFSAAVNLLDKVALRGIMKIETRARNGSGTMDVTADWGTTLNCGILAGEHTIWSGNPVAATMGAWGAWGDFTAGYAQGFEAVAALNYCGVNGTLAIETNVTQREMRIATNGFDDALSAELLDLIQGTNFVAYGELREFISVPFKTEVAVADADDCSSGTGSFDDGVIGWQFGQNLIYGGEKTISCVTADSARMDTNCPGGDFALCSAVVGGLTVPVNKASSASYSQFTPYTVTLSNTAILKVPLVAQEVVG